MGRPKSDTSTHNDQNIDSPDANLLSSGAFSAAAYLSRRLR
ncbi:hypothetical protein [uncultured Corynebacterium sp.]|nr:hypothetical protein [uncultured Corynebacterium sp.]